MALFWPAVWTAATLRLLPDAGSDLVPALVLTVLCGAQALGCAYMLGKADTAAAVMRRHINDWRTAWEKRGLDLHQ